MRYINSNRLINSCLFSILALSSLHSTGAALDCSEIPEWERAPAYSAGTKVQQSSVGYQAKYWTQGNSPVENSGEWGQWKKLGECDALGNQPPTVTLELSANSISLGDTVIVSAETTDADGTVNKVEFFVDGLSQGVKGSGAFQIEYRPGEIGSKKIHAVAFDDEDKSSRSESKTLIVEQANKTANCRPDGLYQTPGTQVPYCTVYDQDGREIMGADHPRRIIGYFTSWRSGDDPQSSYLVKDIPWEQLTHINYAFLGIGSDGKLNLGDITDPNNVTVGKEWDNVEIEPSLGFKGHFGALATYKQRYGVKTLISIGGWAETGGHFDENGNRVSDGGFYTMTTNSDGSINYTGIERFADSAVATMRQYKFDGLDIDYEYPTSMAGAGNPFDKSFMEPRRKYLWASYQELMKVLRQKLDKASTEDNTHYLLTIAAPSSGYLLRGMESFNVTQYLDYVNIMSYDLHGAWNDHVGHNAALYDTGKDSELAQWDVYDTAAYGGIGYLNTDWAYHYFRGSMQGGRINIGVPYYTRGWQGVNGGEKGLWGRAALPDQNNCPDGTGEGDKNNCGNGAIGIDNIWHDTDPKGNEMGAGSSPIWHVKNLERAIWGSYSSSYSLDPVNDPSDRLVGDYKRYYDNVAVAPWLWNEEKKVFLSIEDKESIYEKAEYVSEKGIGGIMFWELAGDYNCYTLNESGVRVSIDKTERACATGNGEFHMGNTMTQTIYERFKQALPYQNTISLSGPTSTAVDVAVKVEGFKQGDQNYPINPKLIFTNNIGQAIPGGTEFQFDMPVSTPDNTKDQSGAGLKVISSGHTRPNNIGGLEGEMHRLSFTLPRWKTLAPGDSYELDMVYYLPVSGPANYLMVLNGNEYVFSFEYPELPLADLSPGDGDGGNGSVTDWRPGETRAVNGNIYKYNQLCFVAKNSPGPWDTPTGSNWFWDEVPCP